MRRSISYTEPKVALAGEIKTWKFIYTPANDLPKGARLKSKKNLIEEKNFPLSFLLYSQVLNPNSVQNPSKFSPNFP